MKYFATTAALVSFIPGIVSLTINTPMSVVQCQPQLLSWTDGAPPYYLSIIPGGQPSAAPLKTFDTQTGLSMTWNVDIPAGTTVTFVLKDSTGATAYTDIVPIQKGLGCGSTGTAQTTSADTGSSGASDSTGSTGVAQGAAAASPGSGSIGPAGPAGSTGSTGSAGSAASAGVVAAGLATTSVRGTASAAPPAATQSRAVASSAGTTSAARTSATGKSGAESLITANGLGFAGFVALAGALFL